MTTKEIKLPKIVFEPKSWPKAEPREELGDNLYAVYFDTSCNLWLYHDPLDMAYNLTIDYFDGDIITFGNKHYRDQLRTIIYEGKFGDPFRVIELEGYDSNSPLVKELVELKDFDNQTRSSIKDLESKIKDNESSLMGAKENIKNKFLPEGQFRF